MPPPGPARATSEAARPRSSSTLRAAGPIGGVVAGAPRLAAGGGVPPGAGDDGVGVGGDGGDGRDGEGAGASDGVRRPLVARAAPPAPRAGLAGGSSGGASPDAIASM